MANMGTKKVSQVMFWRRRRHCRASRNIGKKEEEDAKKKKREMRRRRRRRRCDAWVAAEKEKKRDGRKEGRKKRNSHVREGGITLRGWLTPQLLHRDPPVTHLI